jgi:hypothetical protein
LGKQRIGQNLLMGLNYDARGTEVARTEFQILTLIKYKVVVHELRLGAPNYGVAEYEHEMKWSRLAYCAAVTVLTTFLVTRGISLWFTVPLGAFCCVVDG